MKTTIILLAFLSLTICVSAQAKPDTAKTKKEAATPGQTARSAQKVYPGIPNNQFVTLTLTLPVYMISDYGDVEIQGAPFFENSQTISALRYTLYMKDHKAVLDSLTTKWQQYILRDQARWAADTGKVAKPVRQAKKQ